MKEKGEKKTIKKHLRGLRAKLLTSFLIIIATLVISGGFFMAMDLIIIQEYRSITDTMVSEYKLIDTTSELIKAFNGLVKYANDQDRMNVYIGTRHELQSLLVKLDSSITDYDSQVAYLGLKNTINDVIAECDQGVNQVIAGNYFEVTTHYDNANHKNVFVRENATGLLLKQLEYAKDLQQKLSNTQLITEIIAIILFLVVVTGCIIYAIIFSKWLISPLVQLTKLSKSIGAGDLKASVGEDLLRGKDEVGILANSFNTMVFSLRNNIQKLQEYNSRLVEAKQQIEIENKEIASKELTITQLKDLDKLKNEVLNIATHELKTPLISIVGLTEIMQKQNASLSPDYRKYIDIIHEEGVKLTNLIKNMLTTIKKDNTHSTRIKEKFNLKDLVLSLETSLTMLAKRTESKISFDIQTDEAYVNTEKETIMQVIYNFVDNGVKYGPSGQTIVVSLSKPDKNFAKVAVTDSGKGITEEMQQKLFLKFSQLEPSLSRSKEGMGLGLYICKQNIEGLGGQIGVQSKLGQGSTFYFTVPLSA